MTFTDTDDDRYLDAFETNTTTELIERARLSVTADLLPRLDLAELAKKRAQPVQFAIERIAPLGEVTLFTGPGSGGKSLLAQQLCTAAAASKQCLGLNVLAAPALYLTCEDGEGQLHYRQERICEALSVPMASLYGKLHLASLRGRLDNELEGKDDDGNYAPSKTYRLLADTIKATGARIVALDNVAHLFAGNENDRHDVTRFVNLLNRLAGKTGAAIILIGHPNKSGDAYSGSTAWLNAVRSQVWIDRERDADGTVLDPDRRVLSIGKGNYTRDGEVVRFRWHAWAFVLEDDLPADTRAEIDEIVKANGENAAFMRCLAATVEKRRAVSHNPGTNYAPTVFAKMPEGRGYSRKAFEGAFERLLHLGEIEIDAQLWQRENRAWKYGIRAVDKCTDPLHRPPAPTLSQAIDIACTDPHQPPPPSNYVTNGAGPGGPPPLDEREAD